MNGDVTTYSLNERLTWEQFKSMPKDIQIEYIDHLKENGARAENVQWYLSVGRGAFEAWKRENEVTFPKGTKTAKEKAKWMAYTESLHREEPKQEPKSDLENIFEVLRALAGTGAKLTIEVTL